MGSACLRPGHGAAHSGSWAWASAPAGWAANAWFASGIRPARVVSLRVPLRLDLSSLPLAERA